MVPKKTLAPKTVSQVFGLKKQLERVPISACCNADGSFKFQLLLVEKSVNPRCLKHLEEKKLPMHYRHQPNTWVEKEIFSEWFFEEFVPRVEDFFKAKNLPPSAVLFIDNCKAHKLVKVRNIELAFLSPNVRSLLQPSNQGLFRYFKIFLQTASFHFYVIIQGILQAIKLNYQLKLVNSILTAQSEGVEMVDHLNAITIKKIICLVPKRGTKWNLQIFSNSGENCSR